MSRNTIIAGAIALILIIIGGWYLLSHPSGNAALTTNAGTATTTPEANAATTIPSGSGTTSTTLKAVLAHGGNYTCTIESFNNGTHTTGTVYGTANKSRLDLIVSQNGTDTRTHIIRVGTTAHTWVDGKTSGVKSAVEAGSSLPQPNGLAVSLGENANITTDCHPWVPDLSQFVPPAAITFVSR